MTPRTGIPGILCILALLLLATATPARAETRVALVIGNSAYEHTARLANPRNDAVAMASTLRRLGFDVVDGYDLGIEALRELLAGFG
ncbi:MAG: caspase family protein, partial [Rhodospirillales bacterium]